MCCRKLVTSKWYLRPYKLYEVAHFKVVSTRWGKSICAVGSCSLQGGIYALGKVHMCCRKLLTSRWYLRAGGKSTCAEGSFSFQDGIYSLGKAHMRFWNFPQCYTSNSSSVGLINDLRSGRKGLLPYLSLRVMG